jgi:hypothetical protein
MAQTVAVISAEEYLDYCDKALDQYADALNALGDDLVNERLDVPGSNSAFALTAHVCGVMGRWARQVNRGIVVERDRDAEFAATGSVPEALALLEAARVRLHEDVAASDFRARPALPPAEDHEAATATQGDILLHVYEEVAQHLGHLDVTRDVLLARRA